jgi:hypothetical protein
VASLSRRSTNNPKIKPEAIDSSGKPGITTVAVWVIVDVVWYGDIVATTGLIIRRLFLSFSFSSFNPSSVFHAVNHANGRSRSQAYAFESSDPSTFRFLQKAGWFRQGESNVFRSVLK